MAMALRLVNYLPADRPDLPPRVGALAGEGLIDVAEACEEMDAECGCAGSALALLCCPDCLAMVREALAGAEPHIALDAVKLLAPVPRPGKLFCLAGNYEEHIREGGRQEVHGSDRATPRVFMKPVPNTVCGQGDPIPVARTTQFLDYEGELGVVIGRRARNLKREEVWKHVRGFTCVNDITARDLQAKDGQWTRAKGFDTFCAVGPWIVPCGEAPLHDLRIRTFVNDEKKQDASVRDMVFDIPRIIQFITEFMTLLPGDLIATGTPAGVGPLSPGSVVRVDIEGIGVLENTVIR